MRSRWSATVALFGPSSRKTTRYGWTARIAQQFRPLSGDEMQQIRARADKFKGPQLEDWKRNIEQAAGPVYRDGERFA
ncbi:MAG: hypothetical protein H7039_06785 [Bryobacteraceae bacterium]|nr:hypothetical protein [Bryobacteraceae bacterium]